jgi:hypothetical protein
MMKKEYQFLIAAYKENWRQMRHAENLRLSFTNFYAIIVTGTLAYLSGVPRTSSSALFFFLAGLSFLGFWLCVRLNIAIKVHRKFVEDLATKMGIYEWSHFAAERHWTNILSLRHLYLIIYFCTTIWFFLLGIGLIRL